MAVKANWANGEVVTAAALNDVGTAVNALEEAGTATWSTIPGKPAVIAEGADVAAARTAIGAASTVEVADLRGTVRTGVKGGAYSLLRRRDLPANPGLLSPYAITETVTVNSATTTISGGVGAAFMPSIRVTPFGGDSLNADGNQANSYKFNWRYPEGGGAPNSYPNPKGWGVQFDVIDATELEFLAYARTNAAWLLMIDGRRVTDLPRTTALTYNAQNLIKFNLPNDGLMHRIRFYMNNLSLRTIFATPGATFQPAPLRGPRAFFLGSSIVNGSTMAAGGEIGSWIWRFGEMMGLEDVWSGGVGSTGAIADNGGASAPYPTRATTDVVPASPDLVFVVDYYNDRASAAGDIATAFATTLDNIISGLSSKEPMVIVTGSYDPVGTNGSPYTTIDAALQPVCQARGVPFIEPRTGIVYDGAGNQVLNGAPWINTTNKTTLIGADNVHQTDAGMRYMAHRMYHSVRALLPA